MIFGFVCLLLVAASSRWFFRRLEARHAARAGLLDGCSDLLDSPCRSTSAAGFANLKGRWLGYDVRLSLEEDHATLRKVPSLWLHVSVGGRAVARAGWLDILLRPQNTEFYSPSWDWDGRLEALPGWPEEAIYRTTQSPADLRAIDGEVKRLFADERAKELVVTPRGVRITYQAKQANKGDYLLLRSAVFDETPLPRGQVQELLLQALQIRRNLEAAAGVSA